MENQEGDGNAPSAETRDRPTFHSGRSWVSFLGSRKDPMRLWSGINQQPWKVQGYPVGSGLVKRAVAMVINARMKKRGRGFTRPTNSCRLGCGGLVPDS
ncbi:MAG TPA: hypothetical protein VKR06_15225 [Ktedonosporobacter sp.]|nr:hypothetical protein [Ktedonosporobacter sp.]